MKIKNKISFTLIVILCLHLYGCSNSNKPEDINVTSADITSESSENDQNTERIESTERTKEVSANEEDIKIVLEKPSAPFGYDKLDTEQQSLYRMLENGEITENSPFYFTGDEQKDKKYIRALILYEYNNNRIMAWHSNFYNVEYNSGGKAVKIIPADGFDNKGRDDEMKKAFEESADVLLAQLPGAHADDYTKIKAIAELLCKELSYNYLAVGKYEGEPTAEELEIARYAAQDYGGIVNKSVICYGYAATFKYLCERLGIYCIYLEGHAKFNDAEHSWNMVYLDGAYYHVDITWMDSYTGAVNYKYLLASDDEIFIDHYDMSHIGIDDAENDPELAYLFELPKADKKFTLKS